MQPVYLTGTVVHGFGRGSRDLGCPTANIDNESIERQIPKDFKFGIYYGWAKMLDAPASVAPANEMYKMVASVGVCPFFKNESLSVEVHLIHKFAENFYGAKLKVMFVGYLRGEKNFSSMDDLIAAIWKDVEDAKKALDTPEGQAAKSDSFFVK